jgi:outer membrane protein
MKKIVLTWMMVLVGLVAYAQDTQVAQPTLKFGYLSYDSVLQAMPSYAQMQADMEELRIKYEAELKRVEDDFNRKYEEFLDGQAAFPKTILQKRQSELQEMLDKNIAFKKESQRLLEKAEADAKAPIQEALNSALVAIGTERGYAFILNTDANATPWLNTAFGEDITEDVKALLK